jgi:hypothetical protein
MLPAIRLVSQVCSTKGTQEFIHRASSAFSGPQALQSLLEALHQQLVAPWPPICQ